MNSTIANALLVARREISVRARTRGFLVGLALSALLVAALPVIPKLFGGPDSYAVGLVGARSAALEPAARALAPGEQITLTFTRLPDERAAHAAITAGDLDAAVVDDGRLLADGDPPQELGALLQGAHRAVQTEQRLRAAGLDPARVTEAMRVPPLTEVSVSTAGGDSGVRAGVAMLLVLTLFFLLISAVTQVAMGVVEEKGSRIVELLLTSIRPGELLGGKILGLGALGLLNLVVVIAAGLGSALATGLAGDLPDGMTGIVLGALAWFLLGYAFFSALAAALGSLVSRQEEVSSVLTPMTTLLTAAYLVAFYAVTEPAGTLARVLSLVPPFSSMVMPVRTAAADVPVWEVGVAALLMLLAVAVVLTAGARIYRSAVLRTGARLRLRDVLPAAR
ncbi:ABC-2 type transport system permease protein [Thermocatellispora tengchongensis]|uniref:ABC-2 type transport system permease protein n=1 Tax=Thermocatellispora tengchongensis TaxID=1073253 RepID=A0A840PCN9_9ACTN|nr:ABC transporter permease [Thermocatellispora tengchongensis]MBB5133795.1 ABC-2 type transport system permease protein [Thermocatellispora tengchongensis]